MNTKSFIQQIKTFLIESRKTIFVTAFVVVMISAVLQLVISLSMNSDDEDTTSENKFYTHSFEVYLEQDVLGQFLNADLLEEVLNQSNVIKDIENIANLKIEPLSIRDNETDASGIVKTVNPINVEKQPSTNIMTISLGVGTREENLKTAETYYQWLKTTQLPFFKDKQIYFMSVPHTIESSELSSDIKPVNITRVGMLLFASLFAGILLGTAIAFMRVVFNKKIMYGFAYHWNERDLFLNFSEGMNLKEIEHSVIHPVGGRKVILSEEKIDNSNINRLMQLASKKSDLSFNTDMHQIDSTESIDEFILIIKRK